MAHRTRKLSRNKPKRKTAKRKTSKKKTAKRKSTKKRTKRNAPKRKVTKRRAKKKTTKRSAKKKTAKRKTTKKKSSKKPCTTKMVCIPETKYKALKKQLARLQPKKGDSKDLLARKAKARARVRKQWAALKSAAACQLGQQRARKAGQTLRKQCKRPPRGVKQAAKALGYARAKKAKEKTPSAAALANRFMREGS